MKPPYHITPRILELVATISQKKGEINATHLSAPPAELRKANRIRTIQATLEIEGNTLTIDQVTAILENKRVVGPKKDILEVKNAEKVYKILNSFKVKSLASMLNAHKLLMAGLVEYPGRLRNRAVGIVKGDKLAHLAPPGEMVKPLMNDLFAYLKKSKDLPLIKSCVFHYELEFIHPFIDGNGRIGRLWQTLILKEDDELFTFLPIENIIKKKQSQYYKALNRSDQDGHSTTFIEFMLEIILETMVELQATKNRTLSNYERLDIFKQFIGGSDFVRSGYLQYFKEISPATASRDLRDAVDAKMLERTGEKRMAVYRFIK